MYAYPTQMTEDLIDAIAKLDKVVKYIDIPLQHSHPDVLARMKRPVMDYMDLINKLRKRISGVSIRTSLIVGYPGETDEEFEHLYNFVKNAKFDRMGAFTYSREEGTYSDSLENHIPEDIKELRKDKLMKLQQEISYNRNIGMKGKILDCIVDGYTDDGLVIMRSQYDAPEVDGRVYAQAEFDVVPGDIEKVEITNADEYDLFGSIIR